MRALTDALVLACHRDDFIQKLGNLADIRHMWRFEALRKVGPHAEGAGQEPRSTAGARLIEELASSAALQAALVQQLHQACCWLQVPLLAPLGAAQRSQLCKAFLPQRYAAGSTIVQKGNQGDTFYVIEAGQCTVVNDADQVRPLLERAMSAVNGHQAHLLLCMCLLSQVLPTAGISCLRGARPQSSAAACQSNQCPALQVLNHARTLKQQHSFSLFT